MDSTREKIKEELRKLYAEGLIVVTGEVDNVIVTTPEKKEIPKLKQAFQISYNMWYSKCLPVLKSILPDRYEDFVLQYKNLKPRKAITIDNYTISDYLCSTPLYKWTHEERKSILSLRLVTQLAILQSAIERIDFILSDIKALLQADLFDGELDTAKELKVKLYFRASGVIAGVVLEKHLKKVGDAHAMPFRKAKPTLNDINETLKNGNIYDVPTWRQIQRLADIRNLCAHGSEREPTITEIEELIDGVDKMIKTVF